MKRDYIDLKTVPDQELNRQIAYHEAGHAAAIYLRNKHLGLPPVFFQIRFKSLTDSADDSIKAKRKDSILDEAAVIEGGCLIHSLPVTLIESRNYYSEQERNACLLAFEADIVNLLAGPLAEAKYTALRDNESNDVDLYGINILGHYGGSYDVGRIYDYLDHFAAGEAERAKTIARLTRQALSFINSPRIWQAISELAIYIELRDTDIIECEQVIDVLDASLENSTKQHRGHSLVACFLKARKYPDARLA